MAIVTVEGKFPKRIQNCVLYKLDGVVVIRENSGFTTKALMTSPKYALCRQNASEFGRVSATCKQIRMALKDFLPKKNNLLVVNSLTKKMRQVLVFDAFSARGNRTLAAAMATDEGKRQLKDYHFNPDAAVGLQYQLENDRLQLATASLVFPDGATSVGCTVVAFEFDFETCAPFLQEGEKQFFNKDTLPVAIELVVPKLAPTVGVLFSILEVQFYVESDGAYVPVVDDRSKVVVVVG